MNSPAPTRLRSDVRAASFFERVGYSTVWEDERVIEEGLAPQSGESVVSISSGGDFSLQFLLHDVRGVQSIDFNERQSHLLHFKRAAVLTLEHEELWQLLGLAPSQHRHELYRCIRSELSEDARRYWDSQPRIVTRGVLLSGKQDRFLHLAGRFLELLQGRDNVRQYFAGRSPQDQRQFFDERWNSRLWRLFCDALFSRRVLDLAFHKDHFRYAKPGQHPGALIREQVNHVLREVPAQSNFYFYWVFHRTYPARDNCPAWLRASNFKKLRENLERLRIQTGELEQVCTDLPAGSVDCFNFSNIFDWMSTEVFRAVMSQVVRAARPGARLCYWTNLVNTRREIADARLPELVEDVELGAEIHRMARTPGYSSCTIARIKPQSGRS
jgi:S-adenosylmethionine-diacylglycerol 3-amino-3-carboxypropyl transferase